MLSRLLRAQVLAGIADLKIDGVIHCGFHFGEELADYEVMGVKRVVAFEPVPSYCKQSLKHMISFPEIDIDLRCIGCSNTKGESLINAFAGYSSGLTSLEKPQIENMQDYFGLDSRHDLNTLQQEKVILDTLDNQLSGDQYPYNMLVIDTQGHELNVLQGAESILKRGELRFIDVELTLLREDRNFYEFDGVDHSNKILDLLGSFGFVCMSGVHAHGSVVFAREN